MQKSTRIILIIGFSLAAIIIAPALVSLLIYVYGGTPFVDGERIIAAFFVSFLTVAATMMVFLAKETW